MDHSSQTTGRLAWAAGFCAVLTCILDLGHFHRLHTSDSLIPVLVSLVKWTPFYWEQERYGMVWPLLTAWIGSPLANLLVQEALCIFCGLMAHFLVARHLLRRGPWLQVGALSVAGQMAWATASYNFENLSSVQFYSSPLALALAGLWLAERGSWRRPLGAGLMVLACWFNVATPLIVGALWFASITHRGRRDAVGELILIAMGALAGAILMHATGDQHMQLGTIAPDEWWGAFYSTLCDYGRALDVHLHGGTGGFPSLVCWLAGWLLLGVVGATVRPSWRLILRRWGPPLLGVVGAGLFYGAFVCIQSWAKINGFAYRYWLPCGLMAQVFCVAVGVLPLLHGATRLRRHLVAGVAMWLGIGGALVHYGVPTPSLATVRADLQDRLGETTADIQAADCTHVVGDYWRVWPAVFHASMVRYAAGQPPVWGVTYRATPSEPLWHSENAPWRVAVLHGDSELTRWAAVYRLPPLHEVDNRATVRVLASP